jgi:hypothetical protein
MSSTEQLTNDDASIVDSSTLASSNNVKSDLPVLIVTANRGNDLVTKKANYREVAKPNPLSFAATYSYSVTLYMVSSEIGNRFVDNGGTLDGVDLKGNGVYVVAQSGGIDNSTTRRIPSISEAIIAETGSTGLDYFIDDLRITSLLPGTSYTKSTVTTEMTFTITEPIGISFLLDLRRASDALNTESLIPGVNDGKPNFGLQNYIIMIKFYGYDEGGNEIPNLGGTRYYRIIFESIKFTLDGESPKYKCTARVLSEQTAMGQRYATLQGTYKVHGATISDVLNGSKSGVGGLMAAINHEVAVNRTESGNPNNTTYKVEFLNEKGEVDPNSEIAKSLVRDPVEFSATIAPLARVESKENVDIVEQFKATSFDPVTQTITVAQGQNIVTVIDNLITKSTYVTDALNTALSADVENEKVSSPTVKELRWFVINPMVKRKQFDTKLKDWTYEIVYQIMPYKIPYVRNAYAGIITAYPGPFKFYDYWLTGRNTEILRYTQEYDALYYGVLSAGMDDNIDVSRTGSAPIMPSNRSGNDTSTGAQNGASIISENVRSYLYGVDGMTCKIDIAGDPDFIASRSGVRGVGNSNIFDTINMLNPFSGQTFIQIAFKMACDWNSSGELDISDGIQFYRTSAPQKAGIEGVVYRVIGVESVLSSGEFKQTLDCYMVDESSLLSGIADTYSDDGRETVTIQNRGDISPRNSTSTPAQVPVTLTNNEIVQDYISNNIGTMSLENSEYDAADDDSPVAN